MCRCRICGWESDAPTIIAKEMMQGTREPFEYFICGKCQCLQLVKLPGAMGQYYQQDYYSYEQPNNEGMVIPKEIDHTRVLDVGCGAGESLFQLYLKGFVNLTGCDPFIERDLFYDNGIKVYKKNVHEMQGEYDWILLNDSLEHMIDPHETMESIKRLLAPNGIVKIAVPVFPNIAYEMYGADWFQIDAPRHVCIYSREAMTLLVERHGLKIEKIEYDSTDSQIIRSYLYSKDIPFKQQTPEIMREYFNYEDIQEIIAMTEKANAGCYGDHAIFYLTKC